MDCFTVKNHHADLANGPCDRLLVARAILKADDVESDILFPVDAEEEVDGLNGRGGRLERLGANSYTRNVVIEGDLACIDELADI